MKRPEQRGHARPYHGAVSNVTRLVRAGIVLAIIAVLGWLAGCSDSPSGPVDTPPPEGLIVSDLVSTPGIAPAVGMLAAPARSAGEEVAYVSLPPGTVPAGNWATMRRVGDDGSIVTAVLSGGFDPVAVTAQAGDSIDVIVRDAAGTTVLQARLAVAARRPPVVVRTDPPRKKTDVPLNAAIVVVLSEPVAEASLSGSSVRLLRGTVPVAGTVRLLQGSGSVVAFIPDAPLARSTLYRLVVSRAVRDLEGDALAAGVTVAFTTGQSSTGPAAAIWVSPDTVRMMGATYQMTATVRDAAGNELIDQLVTWSTNDPAALTVSPTGLVTALAAGFYKVTAAVNGLTAEAQVIISGGPPASLVLARASANVGAGDTIVLQATVRDATGRLLDHPSVTWTSSDVAVATVAADSTRSAGLAFATVTGASTGTVAVAASSGTASDTASVTVTTPLPVASVTVTPASVMLVVNGATQLSATLRDANGKVLAGRAVSWTTDNAAVATVDPDGVVTGVGNGSAAVIATSEGVTDTSAIAVTSITFVSIRAGLNHSCGVTTTGAAYCWGDNVSGQLGTSTSTLCQVVYPCSATPVAVSGGLRFSAVSPGGWHTCALTISGAAYCWGANYEGQLGNGSTKDSSVPVPVTGGLTFSALSAGWDHTCGVTTSGAAYCWGANGWQQLGDGSTTSSPIPVAVIGGRTFSALSAAQYSTCGLTTTEAAYCWGNFAVPLTSGLTFSVLSAAWDHTCTLTTSGAAYCWGANKYGQLGDGSTVSNSVPVAVTGGLTFSGITAGGWRFPHTCGVTTGGAAYCWGNYFFSDGAVTAPVPVSGGLSFNALSAGGDHRCGLTAGGVVYCWGENSFGQLGDGTTTRSVTVPVKVVGQP